MGGGGNSNNNDGGLTAAQVAALQQQEETAKQQAADATKQSLSGTQLDWFRLYGQTPQMKDAGINAPFSTVGGGLATPFLTTAGKVAPTGSGAPIGGLR